MHEANEWVNEYCMSEAQPLGKMVCDYRIPQYTQALAALASSVFEATKRSIFRHYLSPSVRKWFVSLMDSRPTLEDADEQNAYSTKNLSTTSSEEAKLSIPDGRSALEQLPQQLVHKMIEYAPEAVFELRLVSWFISLLGLSL